MNKNTKMITPEGKAMWAKVLVPDTKFNPEGLYSVDFIVKQDRVEHILDAIHAAVQSKVAEVAEEMKARAKGKHVDVSKIRIADVPYTEVVDAEGIPTGEFKFKFKLKASGKTREGEPFTQKPALFDAKGNACNLEIGNDSIIKVAFEIIPFYTALIGAGASLRLKAIQIIQLKSYSKGSSGNSFGFGVEDGFEAVHEERSVVTTSVASVSTDSEPPAQFKSQSAELDLDDMDDLFAEN